MANSSALVTSAKVDLLNGVHAFGTTVARAGTSADTWKAALYLASASVGASTTAYSTTGEVSGAGYTPGGAAFTWISPASSGTTAYSTPSASIAWTTVTLSTSFDCVLLYNSTQSNKAFSAHTFGATTVTAGNFSLTMPTNDATTGLIRIG